MKRLVFGALLAVVVAGAARGREEAVRGINPKLVDFEASCFDGKYITGDITADYLSHLAVEREARGQAEADLLEEEKQPG